MDFVRVLSHYTKNRETAGNSDDTIDRLHWQLTAGLFLIFSLVVTAKQYVGNPIDCWCPAQFTSNYVDFTQNLCWVKNTYYVPMEADIPKDDDLKPQLVYYQWTPFILMFQACLFFVPSLLWQTLTSHLGVSIRDITEAGQMYAMASKHDVKEKTINYISKQLHNYLQLRRPTENPTCTEKLQDTCAKRQGTYMVAMYLVVKFVYLGNTVVQFYILNMLLGSDFENLGLRIIKKVMNGGQLQDSVQFPRISLCDFTVRGMGNTRQSYTVECVLSINLFNEKIFIFIWFWLLFVALLTAINIVIWIARLTPWVKHSKIKLYLKTMDVLDEHAHEDQESRISRKKKVAEFTTRYLRADGFFMLRMLNMNSNDLVAAEVTYSLWKNYDPSKRYRSTKRGRGDQPLLPTCPKQA